MKIIKRDNEERSKKTNCYFCGVILNYNEVKKNPNNKEDTRIICGKDFKKMFGKKRKLIKRY